MFLLRILFLLITHLSVLTVKLKSFVDEVEFLSPSMSMDLDDFGTAYLTMLRNETFYDMDLLFPDDPSSKKKLKPGQKLGKLWLDADGEFLGAAATVGRDMIPTTKGRTSIFDEGGEEIKNSRIERQPVVSGFGQTEIAGFSEGQTLVLEAMNGQGGAWMAETNFVFPRLVTFKVFTEDKGKAILSLAEDITKDPYLKIVIGEDDNGRTTIVKKGEEVASVSHSDFPQAKLRAGRLVDYWASFSGDGTIILGQGDVGDNIFLIHRESSLPSKVKKIGFSSGNRPIAYADIRMLPELSFATITNYLWKSDFFTKEEVFFRSVGSGMIEFHNDSIDQSCQLILKEKAGKKAAILEIEQDKIQYSLFDNYGLSSQTFLDTKTFLASTTDRLWFRIFDGQLIFGVGSTASSIKFLGLVQDPFFSQVDRFQFAANRADLKTNSFMGLANVISFISKISSGHHSSREYRFGGLIKVIRPFSYKFRQEGPAIILEEQISKVSQVLGSASQQKAVYAFSLNIKSNGQPELKWSVNPINLEKIKLKAVAMVLRQVEGSLFFKADMIPKETAEDPIAQAQLTAANIALALGGGTARLVAGLKEADIEFNFRHEKDFYVYKDQDSKKALAKSAVSPVAEAAYRRVVRRLELISNKSIFKRVDYDFVLSQLSEIISDITHPYVVGSREIKTKIFELIKKVVLARSVMKSKFFLVTRYKEKRFVGHQRVTDDLISLLLETLRNPYFFNVNNDLDRKRKSMAIGYLNELSSELFSEKRDFITFQPSENFFYWAKDNFLDGEGSAYFEVRGSGDLLVGLSSSKQEVEKNFPMYQVALGDKNNTGLSIYSSHLSKSANAEVSFLENPDVRLSPLAFKPFWINVENGLVQVGQGYLGQNKILEWQDPFPDINDLWLGFQSKMSPGQIKNLAVGLPLSKIDEKDSFAQILRGDSEGRVILSKEDQDLLIWTEDVFDRGSGLVSFQVFGSGSFELFFSEDTGDFQRGARMYQLQFINIGDQVDVVLRTTYQGEPEDIVSSELYKNLNYSDEKQTFWVNFSRDGFIEFGRDGWWQGKIALKFYDPLLNEEDLNVGVRSTGDVAINNWYSMPPKEDIDPWFLGAVSHGKIEVEIEEKAPREMLIEKESDAIDILNQALQEERMFDLLSTQNRQIFADYLYYKMLEDTYDELTFDDLTFEVYERTGGQLFQAVDESGRTGTDLDLDNEEVEIRKLAGDDNLQRGAIQRQEAQSVAGAIYQGKQELTELKGLFQKGGIGFGVKKQFNEAKYELEQLGLLGKKQKATKDGDFSRSGEIATVDRAFGGKREVRTGLKNKGSDLLRDLAERSDLKSREKRLTKEIEKKEQRSQDFANRRAARDREVAKAKKGTGFCK